MAEEKDKIQNDNNIEEAENKEQEPVQADSDNTDKTEQMTAEADATVQENTVHNSKQEISKQDVPTQNPPEKTPEDNKAPQDAGEEEPQKKSGTKKKILLCSFATVFVLLILSYILIGFSYQGRFIPGTSINGVNVSGMTAAQAESAINTDIENYILTIEELNENTEQISGSSIGLRADYNDKPATLLAGQNAFLWGMGFSRPSDYSVDAQITCDEEKLAEIISGLSCMDKSKWTEPVNAYFAYDEENGYQIVAEIPGTEIQPEMLLQAASNAVCTLTSNLSLKESKIYKQASFSADDPKAKEQLEFLKSLSDMTVTYLFGEESEILDIDTFQDWISINNRGKLTVDEDAVRDYVKGLERKYNTAYQPKTLKTTYGPEVTIQRGHYGWMIDRDGETEALTEIIKEGKSVEREPLYKQSAASHGECDYGDSYVEINLTAQHLFLYIDGELVTESDFVSGNPSRGNDTPDGTYPLTYKEKNAVLRGPGYASPVSYWMPFNGNIGMHDSSWRSTYGGVIYKTNGSHGCINLPREAAKTIFEHIEQGFPVLCYFLPGTESAPDVPILPPGAEEDPVISDLNPEAAAQIPASEVPVQEPLPAE